MVHSKGFGLIELMVTLVVASLLMAVAVPAYDQFVSRAKVARAIGDISSISLAIEKFRLNNSDQMPASLADLDLDIPIDPWGGAYVYIDIGAPGVGINDLRKDGKLNPLNTDFDLYSRGRDKDSKGPLSAKASRDDIIRANDGAYVGLGEDY